MIEDSTPYYCQLIEGCLEETVGRYGLSPTELNAGIGKLKAPLANMQAAYKNNSLPLLKVPEDTKDLEIAHAALDRLSVNAKTIVFFGIGGSGLGGRMLGQYSSWHVPEKKSSDRANRPAVRFYNNLDGATLNKLFDGLDLADTRFVLTSKSGGTAETLMQSLAAIQVVIDAGLKQEIPKLFLGLTEPHRASVKNGLLNVCNHYKIPTIDHHTGVGGRFSVLTNVGMLPAIARGLDPFAIRKGAKHMVQQMMDCDDPAEFPPTVGAALTVAFDQEKDIRNLVLMPYCDQLAQFGPWYAQLWAESLGKADGGSTPISALGPIDQHSQLQLYLDGPHDHLVTLMGLSNKSIGPRISPELAKLAHANVLGGRTAGDLVDAEQKAIGDALIKSGRPTRTFKIPSLDEQTLGALIMHFMMETIFAADLYGVDAFDQPAVELGKVLTREYLSQME
ncbi:MAG: glucose-6-phosphate isomerase [bacterium]|nr:glucose-6-phosphate isomerase [bacterium]